MIRIIHATLLVWALFIGESRCCSYTPTHIQDAYCRNSLVIRGKVFKQYGQHGLPLDSDSTIPLQHRVVIFDVEILEVFKGNLTKVEDVIQAVTPASPYSSCSGYLALHNDFVITGNIGHNGQVGFNFCLYMKPFSNLTKFQLKGLRGSYSCRCPVLYDAPVSDRGCSINAMSRYSPGVFVHGCLYDYGICVVGKNNECVWKVQEHDTCNNISAETSSKIKMIY